MPPKKVSDWADDSEKTDPGAGPGVERTRLDGAPNTSTKPASVALSKKPPSPPVIPISSAVSKLNALKSLSIEKEKPLRRGKQLFVGATILSIMGAGVYGSWRVDWQGLIGRLRQQN